MKNEKVLLVTGASSDMGEALIREIASNYVRIYVHYNHGDRIVNALVRDIGERIIPVQADFGSIDETKKLIGIIKEKEILPDHIIHFPAPRVIPAKFHKCKWNMWEEGIETSLRSIVEILQAFLPFMYKQRYGKVVLTLSSVAVGIPPAFQAPYVTVKYALFGLMRALAYEYADKGITVNGVSPHMVETKFIANIPELIISKYASDNPLGRNIRIEEVLLAYQYLLSDGADAVTGQNIAITGGYC